MANNEIIVNCVCGEEVEIAREMLGHIFPCPDCGRNLRISLQFLMLDREVAPNLTAVCTCGRFIVSKTRKAGKKATCKMCGRRVALPKPVEVESGRGPVRLHPKALEKQLRKARNRAREEGKKIPGQKRAGRSRPQHFSLKPGQEVCRNPDCKMPLPPGANVCPRCHFNQATGTRYESPGPENDPVGSWKLKWVKD